MARGIPPDFDPDIGVGGSPWKVDKGVSMPKVNLTSPTLPATKRQVAFLLILAYENCDVTDVERLEMHMKHFLAMSLEEASNLIKEWQKLPTLNRAPIVLQEALSKER